MSDESVTDENVAPPDEDVASRAELLPEERAVGSDDPEAQADAILTESEQRSESRNAAPSTHLEHRSSDEVTEEPG